MPVTVLLDKPTKRQQKVAEIYAKKRYTRPWERVEVMSVQYNRATKEWLIDGARYIMTYRESHMSGSITMFSATIPAVQIAAWESEK